MRRRTQRAILRLMIAAAAGTVLVVAVGALTIQLAFTKSRVLPIAVADTASDVATVTIAGSIYPKGVNKFLLKDSTGAAEIETCPPWFRRVILPMGEHVVIRGEVLNTPPSIAGAKYRLAAYVIERRGEPDIVLRTGPGRPPWADSSFIPRAR